MADARELARICKVLSVDTRVRIIELLKGRALCVGALSARLGVTAGAVSQHLRILRDAGLVTDEKRGYYVHYRLNNKTIAKWKNVTERFLEPGTADIKQCRQKISERRKPCVKKKNAAARSRKT
ncbi:MAG: winged helix-turn-helix transcriptional regulator [Phycisphaerae bacterium]|nr:winged helix-turn-helix transcriptional regulator [Phycisphaerae bacterium]